MQTKDWAKTSFLLFLTLFAVACSNNGGLDESDDDSEDDDSSWVDNGGSIDDDESDSDDSSSTSDAPPIEFIASAVGYTSVTFKVKVKDVLKVEFQPEVTQGFVEDTGYAPNYSKLSVTITIEGHSQTTPLLFNGMNGSAPQMSALMDFSDAFKKTCAEDDEECRQTVTIKVGKPNYDYWCLNWQMYCPYTHVYETHPWKGMLYVHTDDTQ